MKRWTEADKEYLKENYNKLTNDQLKERFPDRTGLSIYKVAYKLHLRKDPDIEYLNRSIARSGANGANWKGGRKKTAHGYIQILQKEHHRAEAGGYVMEHIVVWENSTGMRLAPGYCVHHKNGDKADNRPENLEAMPHGEHTRITHTGLKRSKETRSKISESKRKKEV